MFFGRFLELMVYYMMIECGGIDMMFLCVGLLLLGVVVVGSDLLKVGDEVDFVFFVVYFVVEFDLNVVEGVFVEQFFG